jgi:uncharacterized protein YcbK (DUF882 family)
MFWKDIEYFTKQEFACPCCGQEEMDEGYIIKLDAVREIANVVMVITSGWRCLKHNQRVGGSPTSSHLYGKAADIKIFSDRGRFLLIEAAMQRGINRIGVGYGFVHLDVAPGKAPNVIWTY